MSTRSFCGFLISALTASTLAWAKLNPECEQILAGVAAIPRTVQPEYAVEIPEGGRIYAPGESIGSLPTGSYLYLVTSTGETLIAPKFDLKSLKANGKGLHTHKSLLNLYLRQKGAAPSVVAAGQFAMAFDILVRLDNRSGNFRGEANRLPIAQMMLSALGIPFSEELQIVETNPKDPSQSGHTPQDRSMDEYQLQIHRELAQDPRMAKMAALYEEMFHVLKSVAASPTPEKVSFFLIDKAIASKNFNGVAEMIIPYQAATSPDGFAWGIWNIDDKIKKGIVSPLRDLSFVVPQQLATLVDAPELTLLQKETLRRISRDFKRLRPTNADLRAAE